MNYFIVNKQFIVNTLLLVNKLINLDEMDRFFEKYKLPKLTQFLLNLLLKISPKNVQAQRFYWGILSGI